MERNMSLDAIKVIAMFGVIVLHTTGLYLKEDSITLNNILFQTAVISVPLFFMTSGYLLVDRKNANYRYSSKKIIGIIRYMAPILFLYYLVTTLLTRDAMGGVEIFISPIKQTGYFYVFWYFISMIILYLTLPLMSKISKNSTDFNTLGIVLFVILIIVFQCNITKPIGLSESKVYQCFRIWNWLFYFYLGALAKRKQNSTPVNICLVLFLFVLNILFQYISSNYMESMLCEYYYSSPIVIVLCYMLFSFLLRMHINSRVEKILKVLSPLFLPVYTFHILVRIVVMHFLHPINSWYFGFFLFVCVSFLSIVSSYIIIQLPFAKKYFRI